MLARLAHAHCSAARGLNTRAHISSRSPRLFILDSGTTEPARSTCILRPARLNSTAAHFFPHTRPPDMQVGLECLGSLENYYCYLELRSSPGVGPCLEGRNIACIHSKRFRSRLDTADPTTFADSHFSWTCDLRAPPALVWRATCFGGHLAPSSV
jgi:hypothetical protein